MKVPLVIAHRGDSAHRPDNTMASFASALELGAELVELDVQLTRVNSYKRLVPGYEAPVYICWARRNRSALVRVPLYKPGKEKATRIELRSPDPACNPYLAFSCMVNAGLKGIEKGYKLPEPTEIDVYHLSQEDRIKMGIDQLPGSLIEAIEYAEKSDLLRETLGDHIFEQLMESKKVEWDNYRIKVHPSEIEQNLPVL